MKPMECKHDWEVLAGTVDYCTYVCIHCGEFKDEYADEYEEDYNDDYPDYDGDLDFGFEIDADDPATLPHIWGHDEPY